MAPQPFMIRLSPEDLEQLDALVRARQLEQPQDIATRAAVIRDLIRTAYQRGDHEQPPTREGAETGTRLGAETGERKPGRD
jgi:hypothetical protein